MTPLEIAITQIDKQEIPKGSNWGEDVRKYLLSVGINFPASWCMAFIYWCVEESCKINGTDNPLVKTGGVLHQWNKVSPDYRYKVDVEGFKPQAGDIFIMDYGKGLGHCGFVEGWNEDTTVSTIEGNTNDTGSREGYEVCKRIRDIKKFKGIIRI